MAADTMGIDVYKMRYIAVAISGMFAGVGGAVFAMSISGNFSGATITGQGFLALAAMILVNGIHLVLLEPLCSSGLLNH